MCTVQLYDPQFCTDCGIVTCGATAPFLNSVCISFVSGSTGVMDYVTYHTKFQQGKIRMHRQGASNFGHHPSYPGLSPMAISWDCRSNVRYTNSWRQGIKVRTCKPSNGSWLDLNLWCNFMVQFCSGATTDSDPKPPMNIKKDRTLKSKILYSWC